VPFASVFVNAIGGGQNEFHTVTTIPGQPSVSAAANVFNFLGFPLASATGSAALNGSLGVLVSSNGSANAFVNANVTFHVIAGDPFGTCGLNHCDRVLSGDTLTLVLDGGPATGAAGGSANAAPLSGFDALIVPDGETGGINTGTPDYTGRTTYALLVGEYDIQVNMIFATVGPGLADFSHTLHFGVNVPVGGLFTETSGLVPVTFAADGSPAAVPEPSTFWLLSTGVPLLVWRGLRGSSKRLGATGSL
jgi:hypothetical protein